MIDSCGTFHCSNSYWHTCVWTDDQLQTVQICIDKQTFTGNRLMTHYEMFKSLKTHQPVTRALDARSHLLWGLPSINTFLLWKLNTNFTISKYFFIKLHSYIAYVTPLTHDAAKFFRSRSHCQGLLHFLLWFCHENLN